MEPGFVGNITAVPVRRVAVEADIFQAHLRKSSARSERIGSVFVRRTADSCGSESK